VGVGVGGPTSNLHVVGNAFISSDLTVSGNVSDLNVVSNVNMLHTSNTASIKLNSNVVTEFPRSKKLIKYPRVALTSASRNAYENGYKVTFSSEYDSSTWAAEHVFDNSLEDGGGAWASGSRYGNAGQSYSAGASIGGFDGEYVHLELPVSINLSLVRMLPRTYQLPCPQAPKDYIIIASTDGVTYDLLRRITNEPDTGTFNEILINTPKLYNRFAVVIEKTISSDIVGITEIEFLGTPEYDPEAHGTDVTVKSYPNVPNTDWLKVYYDAKDLDDGGVTNVDDLTPSGINDGTATNVTVSDGAFVFDGGTTTNITTTTATGMGGDNAFSISLWFNPTSQVGSVDNCLVTFGNKTSREQFLLTYNPNKLLAQFFGNGMNIDVPGGIQFGRWYHVVLTYPGGGHYNMSIYADGIKGSNNNGGTNLSGLIPTNAAVELGKYSNSYNEGFNGSIANFRLFNRVLTTDEIYQLYAYQKEYFGHGDLSMTLKAGRLGIGTSEPRAMLDVRDKLIVGHGDIKGNAVGVGDLEVIGSISIGALGAGVLEPSVKFYDTSGGHARIYLVANDVLGFEVAGYTKGYLRPDSGVVWDNFTGQHRTFIKDVPFSQASNLEGLIVSSDQNKYIKMSGGIEVGSNAITTNESLPVVSLSNVVTDKKCFGVISASEDPEERRDAFGNFVSVTEKEKGDTRVYINSVGEGAIWVVNTNGSLESGDYITTSNVTGYGQKQESEFLANYTVAKITMDCDFNPATQSIQIIKKDEEGENVLDEHGQIQWEDHPTETEKAYKVRYLTADGAQTDEANTVHIAAFVGCTYHCG
jgi:hypothetical protein